MLTTISSCICKYRKESSEVAVIRKSFLFRAFSLSYSLVILSCYNCVIEGILSCYMSKSDSGCYKVCVLTNRISCNILGVIER